MAPTARNDITTRAYFDAATAAPLHPVARQAMSAALDDGWADPGRLYTEARRAAQLLDAARDVIAECLGTRPDEVAFCASGSHAAQLAIDGVRDARATVGAITVHSAIEHSSVLRAAQRGPSREVAVDRLGHVELDALATALAEPGVAVAAIQSANHEVGTRQPIAAVAAACEANGVPLYVDAAQTVPWEPLSAGWSLASASAVKWGGPAGVGVLAVRKGTRWARPWPVDRTDPWTVPLPLVVAAAAALRIVRAGAAAESVRLSGLVDRIRTEVAATVPDVEVVGDPVDRVPHIVTFSCLYADGEALLHALDRQGFAVSSGSACTASTLRPSHVLAAMGVLTHGNIRVSLHPGVRDEDVTRFLAVLPKVVADLRAEAGVADL
ncbi:MAG TPA: aminotransferase class V-fold PLP-dependent enzyme [Micromonosporaceae bacterium]|nr:aminotransferase class V-fold PLP-dependent enzyme [Micromonosporaceae bacterium]